MKKIKKLIKIAKFAISSVVKLIKKRSFCDLSSKINYCSIHLTIIFQSYLYLEILNLYRLDFNLKTLFTLVVISF